MVLIAPRFVLWFWLSSRGAFPILKYCAACGCPKLFPRPPSVRLFSLFQSSSPVISSPAPAPAQVEFGGPSRPSRHPAAPRCLGTRLRPRPPVLYFAAVVPSSARRPRALLMLRLHVRQFLGCVSSPPRTYRWVLLSPPLLFLCCLCCTWICFDAPGFCGGLQTLPDLCARGACPDAVMGGAGSGFVVGGGGGVRDLCVAAASVGCLSAALQLSICRSRPSAVVVVQLIVCAPEP